MWPLCAPRGIVSVKQTFVSFRHCWFCLRPSPCLATNPNTDCFFRKMTRVDYAIRSVNAVAEKVNAALTKAHDGTFAEAIVCPANLSLDKRNSNDLGPCSRMIEGCSHCIRGSMKLNREATAKCPKDVVYKRPFSKRSETWTGPGLSIHERLASVPR